MQRRARPGGAGSRPPSQLLAGGQCSTLAEPQGSPYILTYLEPAFSLERVS